MKVKAIKGVKHNFHENAGPSETVTLGLEIDGIYLEISKYYFGPGCSDVGEHYDIMENFVNSCETLFFEADSVKEECAELIVACSKQTRGKGDDGNLIEEMGDVLFTVCRILEHKGWTFDELLEVALVKIGDRFPEFFESSNGAKGADKLKGQLCGED